MVNGFVRAGCVVSVVAALTGCNATMPSIGDSQAKTVATGSAGGSNSTNANSQLERCDSTLGTLAVVEDQGSEWYRSMQSQKLGSTVPVLRLLIQQSNCFVIVERGAAMSRMAQERQLAQSGELRSGSRFESGQMVAADYTLNPSITFSQKGTSGLGGALFGAVGGIVGSLAAGLKTNDAATLLTLIDNRSGVQIAAAEGSARNMDFNASSWTWFGALGNVRGYTDTPEGKVLTAAFVDSYNQMVRSLRNYKAQEVKGGLGKGGNLRVGQ
jgi:hypothetical protein